MIARKRGFGQLVEHSDMYSRRSYKVIFHKLRCYMLVLVATTSISCAGDASNVKPMAMDQEHAIRQGDKVATVGNSTLRLKECDLSVETGSSVSTHRVKLPVSCRFIVDRDGQPQTVNTDLGPTLLIASSYPLPTSRFCDTRVRAVTVRENGILVSDKEQRIRTCSKGPFDNKMFHVLAQQ
jgi:hypothetical protein